ncbi:MAG: hypothetical protein MN733_11700, partial [Nitrososphaera sp.]|nr:hypothetical protein [Nitrososphaera sp.]
MVCSTINVTCPWCVHLPALLRRFITICVTFALSIVTNSFACTTWVSPVAVLLDGRHHGIDGLAYD